MKGKHPTIIRAVAVIVVGLMLGAIFVSAVQASPPAQDPRPPVGNGGNGGDGGTTVNGGNGNAGGDATSDCASVLGQAINWGNGGTGGVTINLGNGSWQLSTVSATDGNYGFGGLGTGIATLQIAADPLQSHIQNAGVFLNCNYPVIANIGVSSANITPPATIKMSASKTVIGDDGTDIILTVENNLPNDITNVVVTNLIPQGMAALDVTAVSATYAEIVDGSDSQLVSVYLDALASGATTKIRINVIGATDTASLQTTNTATLFYRESIADQASLDFTVQRSGALIAAEAADTTEAADPTSTPVTSEQVATATPEAEATADTAVASPEVSPTEESEDGEEFVPPDGLPTTGNDFVPPGFLPITGQDLLPDTGVGILLPLSGFGFAALAIFGHYARSWYRHKK